MGEAQLSRSVRRPVASQSELRQIAGIAAEIDSFDASRINPLAQAVIRLRCRDAQGLATGLSSPTNGGRLFVRHLLRSLTFDEHRVCAWRFEHKLVQALLLEHYAPGVVPATAGAIEFLTTHGAFDERKALAEWVDHRFLIKAALGNSSGETHTVDVRNDIALDTGHRPRRTLLDEQWVIQERIDIAAEYRVHSLEGEVATALTLYRHGLAHPPARETTNVNAFVQGVLDRLPNGLTRDTLFGWDVARDHSDRLYIIEANPSGYHLVHNPGFQCSGYFQRAEWTPGILGRLLLYVESRYNVRIEVELDDPPSPELAQLYWWVSYCTEFLRTVAALGSNSPERFEYTLEPTLSREQNAMMWTLAELRRRVAPSP